MIICLLTAVGIFCTEPHHSYQCENTMTKPSISVSLNLPCGAVLKNRLAKSAMSENMGSKQHTANEKFERAYERWADGGAGLLITGNVMIDSSALGEPDNVVIEDGRGGFENLQRWARAGTKNNTHLWMQLNHPGKQSPKFLSQQPVAPSPLQFESSLAKLFNRPRELSDSEILNLIERFAYAAKTAKDAGFTGVQIHGAHGYLVSQFLSPKHNVRTDKWGGSLDNRMRFVLQVYEAMRRAVGKEFPLSIKLNSADFQKGGFTEEESIAVSHALSQAGMDLIEISGGTYEAPEMTGYRQARKKESTARREAYFLEYCEKVRSTVKTPLMLTGGFRSRQGMDEALASHACDVIGLARSLAVRPQWPRQLLAGDPIDSEVKPLSTGFKSLDKLFPLEIIWYTQQIHRMGQGLEPNPRANVLGSAIKVAMETGIRIFLRTRA